MNIARFRPLLLAAFLIPRFSSADTPVSGTITTNTTWTLANSPYVVTGSVTVEGGSSPVLTIQPGVTVKFASSQGLYIGGSNYPGGLQAIGTPSNPITFTSSAASPTRGSWRSIYFNFRALASSRIAYATVSWGGAFDNAGIVVDNSSPTLDNVTVSNSSTNGIWAKNVSSNPTISNTTATLNSASAIAITSGGRASLTGVTLSSSATGLYLDTNSNANVNGLTLTNNSGYAISQDGRNYFSSATGITATGNGTNAIEVRTSTVDTNTTWKNVGLPYVATGFVTVQNSTNPVLTIEPGVTVKFASSQGLYIGGSNYPGGLQAIGTPSNPITFTSSAASPTRGSWRSIFFNSRALASSRIAYATVNWGGAVDNAGIVVDNSSPTLDNVTVSNSSTDGIAIRGAANPVLTTSTISNGTGPGITITGGAASITGSTISGTASGTGDGSIVISGGNTTIEGVTVQNSTKAGIVVSNGTAVIRACSVSGTIRGSGNGHGIDIRGGVVTVQRTNLIGNAGTAVAVSGGAGHIVQNSVFSGNANGVTNSTPANWVVARLNYWNEPSGPSGYGPGTGQAATTGVYYDPWLIAAPSPQEYVTAFSLSGRRFNPTDGPTSWDLSCSLTGTWSITVRDTLSNVVRTLTGSGTPVSMSWDGKSDGGILQADGTYNYLLETTSSGGTSAAPAKGFLFLDGTMRVAISSPGATELLSNVYRSGQTVFPVSGTVTMASLSSWTLDYGAGAAPASWTTLATGTAAVPGGLLANWDTTHPFSNGLYTLRLRAIDTQDDLLATAVTPTIGHFNASLSKQELNLSTSEQVTVTSIVPFSLTETLVFKNASGQTIRTLVSANRAAGTYNDVWDGTGDGGAILADDLYTYVAGVTDGTINFMWDLTGQNASYTDAGGGVFDPAPPSFWDPFNNQPLSLTFNFTRPGKVSLHIFDYQVDCSVAATHDCTQPGACLYWAHPEPSGQRTFRWASVDATNAFRSHVFQICATIDWNGFWKNTVLRYGRTPKVDNVSVTPPLTGAASTQTVAYDLTTYPGDPATVAVEFLSLESVSVLRTITTAGVAAGHRTVPWDGRADNGALVAPGFYIVRVTAQNSLGNSSSCQTLSTVQH